MPYFHQSALLLAQLAVKLIFAHWTCGFWTVAYTAENFWGVGSESRQISSSTVSLISSLITSVIGSLIAIVMNFPSPNTMQGMVGAVGGGHGRAPAEDACVNKVSATIPTVVDALSSGLAHYPYSIPQPWPTLPIVQGPSLSRSPPLPPPVFMQSQAYLPYLYPSPYYTAPYGSPYPTFAVPPHSDVGHYSCAAWPYAYGYADAAHHPFSSAPPAAVSAQVTCSAGNEVPLAAAAAVLKQDVAGPDVATSELIQADVTVSDEALTASVDKNRRKLDNPLSYVRKRNRDRLLGRHSVTKKTTQPTSTMKMTHEDRERLLSAPVDQWVDSTYEAALRFMNVKRRPRSISRSEEGATASCQERDKTTESSVSSVMPIPERSSDVFGICMAVNNADSDRCDLGLSSTKVTAVVHSHSHRNARRFDGFGLSGISRDLNKKAVELETSGSCATRSLTVDSEPVSVQDDGLASDDGRPPVAITRGLDDWDFQKGVRMGGLSSSETVASSKGEMSSRLFSEREAVLCRDMLGGRSMQSCVSVQDAILGREVQVRAVRQGSYDGDGASSLSQSSESGHMEGRLDHWRRGWAQSDAAKATGCGLDCSGVGERAAATVNSSGSAGINPEIVTDRVMWSVSRERSPPPCETTENSLAKDIARNDEGRDQGFCVREEVGDLSWRSSETKLRQFDLGGMKDQKAKPEIVLVDGKEDSRGERRGHRNGVVDTLGDETAEKKSKGTGGCDADDGEKSAAQCILQWLVMKQTLHDDRNATGNGKVVMKGAGMGGSIRLFGAGDGTLLRADKEGLEKLRADEVECTIGGTIGSESCCGFARCA